MNKGMPKGRNATAMVACFKKAGTFHHKVAPRGGTANRFRDFMELYEDDYLNPYSEENDYSDPLELYND
jgi:hypothetical protein